MQEYATLERHVAVINITKLIRILSTVISVAFMIAVPLFLYMHNRPDATAKQNTKLLPHRRIRMPKRLNSTQHLPAGLKRLAGIIILAYTNTNTQNTHLFDLRTPTSDRHRPHFPFVRQHMQHQTDVRSAPTFRFSRIITAFYGAHECLTRTHAGVRRLHTCYLYDLIISILSPPLISSMPSTIKL